MKRNFVITLLGLTAAICLPGAEESSVDKRLKEASDAFTQVMRIPERTIPEDLLARTECIVVIPGLKKAAFLVGGKYGRGFASCRQEGKWGAPSAIRIEGGSFGLQIGGSSTDVVLLVMNQRGMERLTSDKFTIGAEATAAAGPVGRHASANTDVLMTAEILSYSRSRGAFAGISLDGATLRPDNEENELLYGKPVNSKDILTGGVAAPARAQAFISTLQRYAPRRVA